MRKPASLLAVPLAALLVAPPLPAIAGERALVPLPSAAQCQALPAPGAVPWKTGETLSYGIDVMGASAGELALVALPPVGSGSSRELQLRALAKSNSFFSKIRRVRGKATSYVRARDMHPRRYREDTFEGESTKSAEVSFRRPQDGRSISIAWTRNKVKGRTRLRYASEAFDPISAAYYLRTLPLSQGQSVCFDSYALRKLWRITGTVKGVETIRVPAGVFQAYHLEGVAIRVDNPRSQREVHMWISTDERRLPLASMSVFDLGPVRAQLTHVGESAELVERSFKQEPARGGRSGLAPAEPATP